MLVAELQELEEVKNLMNRGQQLGVLTFGDIASAVSEVDLDESDVEDLYGHLEKSGIELVEDEWAKQLYHAAEDLKPDAARDLVERGVLELRRQGGKTESARGARRPLYFITEKYQPRSE